MTFAGVLGSALRSATRSYRMIGLLYLINVLLALIVALAFRSVLLSAFSDSMVVESLMEGFDFTVYSDFINEHGAHFWALYGQVVWLALFFMLVNVLLGGGTIATLNAGGEQFSLRSFFEGCGRYLSRFLRLFLVFAALAVIVSFVWASLLGVAYSGLTADTVTEVPDVVLFIVAAILFFIPLMLLVMMTDYAKIATVVDDENGMLRTFWRAVIFVFRHFFRTVGFQLAILFILLISIVLYWLVEGEIGMGTTGGILAVLVIQQASVGVKIWTRVATFAGELAIFKGLRPAAAPEPQAAVEAPAAAPEPALLPQEPPRPSVKKPSRRRLPTRVRTRKLAQAAKRGRRSRR